MFVPQLNYCFAAGKALLLLFKKEKLAKRVSDMLFCVTEKLLLQFVGRLKGIA
jgi:hypothetical protein